MQEELKPDDVGMETHSDELKQSYLAVFLSGDKIGPRKNVCATKELTDALHHVASILGYDNKATIGTYAAEIIRFHFKSNENLLKLVAAEGFDHVPSSTESVEDVHKPGPTRQYVKDYLCGDEVNRNGSACIHLPRELVDKLRFYVNMVRYVPKPTVGSYVEAIICEHFSVYEDMLSEMIAEKLSNRL